MLDAIKEFWFAHGDGVFMAIAWGGFAWQMLVLGLNLGLFRRLRRHRNDFNQFIDNRMREIVAAREEAHAFVGYALACEAAWRQGETLPEPPPEIAFTLPPRGRLN